MEDSNEEKLSKTALVDRISEQIHAKILSGEYKLGEPLRQQALAAEFGVSRTPIREALRKLEASELIKSTPNHGAIVQGPTPRAIREAYVVRAELEGLAAELAASRVDDEDLMELRAAEQEFRTAVMEAARVEASSPETARTANDAWVRANDRFHEAILVASGNERLHKVILDLHRLFPRNLTWAALHNRPQLLDVNVEEHRRIMNAIERHDPGSARIHMSYHVQRSGELVAERFEREYASDRDRD